MSGATLTRFGRAGIAAPLCALLLFALASGGCRGKQKKTEEEVPGVIVEPEDIAVVALREISAGPLISGSLQAGTEARILAEIAGTVTEAPAKEGEHITRGALLARISVPGLAEQRRSAESAVSSAETATQNARRDLARTETLAGAGAVARREVETARGTLAAAEAQLATARSQLAAVIKDIAATTVEATITGVVSARLVSRGDVVQVGTELYRIVDLASMMLDATIPAEELAGVRVGSPVHFEIRGYPGRFFTGKVERINPTADPATRQVTIHVSIPNPDGALIAGLFAEGMVTTAARNTLVVPAAAVQQSEGESYVMRIHGGVVEEVSVRTGLRDQNTQQVEIRAGLARGDTVLVGPAMEIVAGTPVQVQQLTTPPTVSP